MKNLDFCERWRERAGAGEPGAKHYPLAFTSATARAISSSMVRRI
jgi:hypothetical protein